MEFADRGFKGAVLESIADAVGIGKSSFYYYFTDKEDLFKTVLDEAWQQLRASRHIELEDLAVDTFWPEYENAARANLELCAREPWLIAAAKLLNRAPTDPTAEVMLATFIDERQRWQNAWIARGQALGVIRSDLPTGLLAAISLGARQASNIWMIEQMEHEDPEKINRLALKVITAQQRLLAPPSD